eukprot:6197583-Alexandrium_andersonii.AAC.1
MSTWRFLQKRPRQAYAQSFIARFCGTRAAPARWKALCAAMLEGLVFPGAMRPRGAPVRNGPRHAEQLIWGQLVPNAGTKQ